MSIIKLVTSFFKGHKRTIKAKRNILISLGARFIAIAINFLFVPLMLNVLDKVEYGIWLTLTSVISWFSFFDMGLGNGLRNMLTESLAQNQFKRAKIYVSTAYAGISIIISSLLIVIYFVFPYLELYKIFSVPETLIGFRNIVAISVCLFLVKFIFELLNSILLADLESGKSSIISSVINLLTFLIVYSVMQIDKASFYNVSLVISLVPVVVLLISSVILFNRKYKNIRPSFGFIRFGLSGSLFKLGFKFFFIQIAVIILFSTDNFIITKILGPEEVVPYNISFKYFGIITMLFTIVTGPLWSSITEAYVKREIDWIKKTINTMLKVWGGVIIIAILMLFFSQNIYRFWLGDDIIIKNNLSFLMFIYVIMGTFSMIYTNFINGVGAVRLQLYTATVSMLINIPLSIFFAKNMEMGSVGVILATCISLSYSIILKPLQYNKIINNKAKGIWIK